MLVGSIRTAAEDSGDPVVMLRRLHDRLRRAHDGRICYSACRAYSSRWPGNDCQRGTICLPTLMARKSSWLVRCHLGITDSGGNSNRNDSNFDPAAGLRSIPTGWWRRKTRKASCSDLSARRAISTKSAAAIVAEAVEFGQEDDITVVTIERLPAHEFSSLRKEPLLSPCIEAAFTNAKGLHPESLRCFCVLPLMQRHAYVAPSPPWDTSRMWVAKYHR